MLTTKVQDLDLLADLDPKSKDFETIKEILEMFKFENLTDAREMLEGFSPVVDSFIKEEMIKRPLVDLKATFL